MKRLMYASTSAVTLEILMVGHLRFMAERGYDVTAVASPGPGLQAVAAREGVRVEAVPMRRSLSPLRDLVALGRIVRLLRRQRPEIVNAGTPKAGLLFMVAARLVGVPVRIYTLRGLKAETATGWNRQLLLATERIAAWCATDVVCVSESLRRAVVSDGLVAEERAVVLGSGSSNGVDLDRFWSSDERRREAREEFGVDPDTPLIGFVGRLVRDKGIEELVEAFDILRRSVPEAVLILAGDYEEGDPVAESVRRRIAGTPGIRRLGHVEDTARLYPALDLLAFPSAREGLPNAPLEAAANAVPTVAFDATGSRDVIIDGSTGALVPSGDVASLAQALERYLRLAERRVEHGERALKLVSERFSQLTVWQNLLDLYRSNADSAPAP